MKRIAERQMSKNPLVQLLPLASFCAVLAACLVGSLYFVKSGMDERLRKNPAALQSYKPIVRNFYICVKKIEDWIEKQ